MLKAGLLVSKAPSIVASEELYCCERALYWFCVVGLPL